MVLYQELGFKTEDDYYNKFFSTLLSSNTTYEYFVNWQRVKENVKKYTTEIGMLNSLINVPKSERENKLREILRKYPEVVPLIPALIAVRENSIEVYDVLTNEIRLFGFKTTSESVDDLIHFCKKTGLLEAFDEINDLHTYLLGVEVGTDTNARKNRSGDIFQQIVELRLKKKLQGLNVTVKPEYKMEVVRKKTFDFAILKDEKPLMLIECNFYGGTGSKPIETANAYIDLQKKVRDAGIKFVWVTDGKWGKMQSTFKTTSKEMDYVLNLNLLEQSLKQIVEKASK